MTTCVRLLRRDQRPRGKLDTVNTLQDVASLLRSSKKIVVLAGAGISVSCGIPDFRSENGIYSVRGYDLLSDVICAVSHIFCVRVTMAFVQRLSEYNLPNPQCMFGTALYSCCLSVGHDSRILVSRRVDIEFFRSNPRPFFAFAKELFPKSSGFTFVPSRSHYFLKLLEEKGKLLRIYSQVRKRSVFALHC